MDEEQQLEQAIAALEGQRALLGDGVVDAALAPMRAKLQTLRATGDQQLKFVSVLFADVVGSTHMIQTLDPEEISGIIDGAMRRFAAAIERYGGAVRNFMGDGLLALFGFPVAGEDDAERAIRAGLAMLDEARDYTGEVEAAWGFQGFAIRIGINTGQVILGGGVDRDTNALGVTTSIAARMQAAAPPGGLLITHDTYLQVRGVFDVEPQAPLLVKGRDEPLQTYVVRGAKARAFRLPTRGVEEIETHMIGREAELQRLQDAFRAAIEDGEGQIVTVVGEAGVGKSRLIYEFDSWLELLPEQLFYFRARAQAATQNQAYSLLRDLFSFRFGIRDSDPSAVVRDRVERGLAEGLAGNGVRAADVIAPPEPGETGPLPVSFQEEASVIGRWLGFDLGDRGQPAEGTLDTRQLRDRALAVLEDYLRGLARRDPVVILLEDIHWADDSSLDVVRHLAPLVERLPMLVVCAARPVLFERRPHWGEGQATHMRLDLQPLSKRDSRRLVDEILQKVDEIPNGLRELVAAGAEGNPFYIEELIKMLIEDGVIKKGSERWHVEQARLSSLRVPPTLTGVLQARVDSLSPGEKGLLQRASVVGRTFWDTAVRFLAPEPERQAEWSAPDFLQRLRSREMIYQHEESAFEGALEYLFKHTLLRDVTYQSVLKRDRRLYHARAAGWLEEVTLRSGRADEYATLIAEHYQQAGEAGAAARWYRRAGEHAVERFANAEAIHSFTRALELAPTLGHEERFSVLLARERAYGLQGARPEQEKDVEALVALAGDLGDDRRLAQAWLRRARYVEALGDYGSAISAAQRAVELAQAAGAPEEQGDGYRVWGGALWSLAEYPEAGAVYERALAVCRSAGDRSGEASALRGMGLVQELTGSYAAARAHYEQALRIYREMGDLLNESRVANDLGVLGYNQNDLPGAQTWYEMSLRLKHKVGDRRGEGAVLNNLGIAAHEQGQPGQARTRFAQSLELCRQIRDPEGEAAALNGLGSVDRILGDYNAALHLSDQALEIVRQIGDRLGEADVLLSIGYVLLAKGELGEAEIRSLEGLRLTQEIDAPREQAFALSLLGRVHLALARPDEAEADFRRSYDLRRGLDEHVPVAPALAGMAAAALARGDVQQAAALAGESLLELDDRVINDVDDPFWVSLMYYRALSAAGDPRAAEVLAAARQQIDERAARVEPELREAWLFANPAMRELRGA